MRTARFWWVFLGFVTGLMAWYAVQVHQTKYLIEIGFAPAVAATALGLVSFMGIGGQIGLGHLSDRIGREWAWTLACLGYALCYAALLVMREHPTTGWLYVMVGARACSGTASPRSSAPSWPSCSRDATTVHLRGARAGCRHGGRPGAADGRCAV